MLIIYELFQFLHAPHISKSFLQNIILLKFLPCVLLFYSSSVNQLPLISFFIYLPSSRLSFFSSPLCFCILLHIFSFFNMFLYITLIISLTPLTDHQRILRFPLTISANIPLISRVLFPPDSLNIPLLTFSPSLTFICLVPAFSSTSSSSSLQDEEEEENFSPFIS